MHRSSEPATRSKPRAPGDCLSIDLTIREDDVVHFLGYPRGRKPPGRIQSMLGDILEEARALACARGAYCGLPVSAAAEVGLTPVEAEALIIGLVTAGIEIEKRVSELLKADDMTRALLLDAAGSAAAEEAANRLSAHIVGEDSIEPTDVSCRISPGYGRWPLTAQPALFERLPHRELGVALTPSMMMIPRKSISFAMWIGPKARPLTGLSGCATCGLDHCRYRRAAGDGRPRETNSGRSSQNEQ